MIIEQAVPINYPEPSYLRHPYYTLIATNTNKYLPTITLEVSPDKVPEDEDYKLLFKFTRTGDIKKPLNVYYSVNGTAKHEKDYKAAFSDSVIQQIFIPTGISSVVVEVTPIEDREFEPDETVILRIVPDDSYNLATIDDVSGVIRGNRAAFAWLNYAPVAAFATPLILSPWDNNFSHYTNGEKREKKTELECTTNCYYVPGPLSFLALIQGYFKTRKFRTLRKRAKSYD